MNFFHFKLNTTRKGSKILYSFALFSIIFLILCTYSYSQENTSEEIIISEGKLVEEKNIGEYTYRRYIGPPHREDVFQIYKGEELVYQSEVEFGYGLREEDEIFHQGDDITGDGIPNLIVEGSNGGSVPYGSCYVFSLGKKFHLIQILPEGKFKNVNQDGNLCYITYQMGFYGWHASHADSAAPKLVYEYCGNDYLLAPALMYQPLPKEEVINQTLEEVKKRCAKAKKEEWRDAHCWHNEEVYLDSSVWNYMLKLMFSGHPDEAYDFLDKVWPEGEEGKSNFIYDFEKPLSETIWPALAPMFARIAQVKKEDPSASLEEEITQGVIRIWASPENTKVYVNNQYLGEAPISTDLLAPGEYNIRLSQPGYYDTTITAEVVPLHIQEVKGSLKQKVGNNTLFISSTTDEAVTFLDDTYIGVTPLKVEKILAGGHSLAFMKPGYHLYKETYTDISWNRP